MATISIEHLDYTYEIEGMHSQALGDINLEIADGEFICLVGRSGCGKTTLLNILAGLLKPTAGRVLINGSCLDGPGTDRAIVFQDYSLFPWMTAYKNVLFGIKKTRHDLDGEAMRSLACSVLDDVGMGNDADKYPHQLSGGMQQRVAIARALAMSPDILLLDEPFGALDAAIREDLQRLLEKLWLSQTTFKTVVFVTHDVEESILLADRIILMRPQVIEKEFVVDIERPRNRDALCMAKDYLDIKHAILDRLRVNGAFV